MLWWLVDHATLLYVLLGLAAIGLAAGWWHTRKPPLLIALYVTLGLIVLLWLLTLVIVSDRMRLRRAIEEMADAIGKKEPANIVKHLANDFQFGTVTRNNAGPRLARAIALYQLQDIYTWDFDFEKLDRERRSARVAFRARVTHAGRLDMFLCRAEFVLEGEQWLLQSFNVYNPFVDTDRPLPNQVP